MGKQNRSVWTFIGVLLVLVTLGYLGYRYGFLGFIYQLMIPNAFSQYHIVVLSVIFGMAAFFSPCAFTVLPGYLSTYVGNEEGKRSRGRALYLGAIAGSGIILVNMAIGLAIALLGSATPFAKDPRQDIPVILAVRALSGLVMAGLGVSLLLRKSPSFHFVQKFFSGLRLPKNMFAYGVMYNAAALGCTGPILLALILYAYASGSFLSAMTAFGVFSLTMGILMALVTAAAGAFKYALFKDLERVTPAIKTAAAVVMVAAGLSVFLLTVEGNALFVKLFFPYLPE